MDYFGSPSSEQTRSHLRPWQCVGGDSWQAAGFQREGGGAPDHRPRATYDSHVRFRIILDSHRQTLEQRNTKSFDPFSSLRDFCLQAAPPLNRFHPQPCRIHKKNRQRDPWIVRMTNRMKRRNQRAEDPRVCAAVLE